MPSYRKHTKKIAIAILIIVLCIVALTGTTVALFTNGDDGVIGINVTGGDIKIDIIGQGSGSGQTLETLSLRGKTLRFIVNDVPVEDENLLWEPGAVYYTEPFAVVNCGDIAINYIIYIDCTEKDEKKLNAFEFYIVSATELAQMTREEIKSLSGVEEMQKHEGYLEAPEEGEEWRTGEYYRLVVRMKDDLGNEYGNFQWLDAVGITVYAVQGNVDINDVPQSESTGNESETATETNIEINTETETSTETIID